MLTIGVDVDGVVADLCTAWLNRYNKDYNDNLKPSDIKSWGTHEYVRKECGLKIYDYIEDPKIYDVVLPTSPDALITINKIRHESIRIVYITTSTLGASGAKFKWLKEWGFIDDMKDYVEATDKTIINADVLIDDRADGCKAWYEARKLPILFTQPWNEKIVVPYYHTNNWDTILQAILFSTAFFKSGVEYDNHRER